MYTRTRRWLILAILVFAIGMPVQAATSRSDVVKRLEDFRRFFLDFQFAPDSAVPGELLAQCYGVMIMRQYKAGFIFGVRGGDGVVFLHDPHTGQWSPPAFIATAEGSFGFQIGGQAIDAIILIMNRSGLDMLLKTRFKVGVDASAAAGPVGRDASAKVGPGTALLAYSRAKGLYAGVAFEGGAMLNNNPYNKAMYGRDIGIREILFDRQVPVPAEAIPILETLGSYAFVQGQGVQPVRAAPPAGMQPMAQPEPIIIYPTAAPVLPELEPLQPLQPVEPEAPPIGQGPSRAELAGQARMKAAEAERAAEAASRAAQAALAASEAAQAAEAAARAAGQ